MPSGYNEINYCLYNQTDKYAMSDIDRVLRSNLKLKHLQLLVALDEFRHLGRVSEFLSLTQPAVSKALAEIETIFGLRLFTRSTRGTEPTEFGIVVVRFARSVLADFDRTRDEITALNSGVLGRTSVGTMVVALPGLLLPAIQALKADSALTTVSIEEGDLTRLLPRLRTGEIDLFVGRLEPGYSAPDLETEALSNEEMTVVIHPDHPLAHKPSVDWADLSECPWVVPPPWAASRVKLIDIFHRHHLHPPTNVVESASFLVIMAFLRQAESVGFVARSVSDFLEKENVARRLPIRLPMELPAIGMITIRGRQHSPTTLRLMECLRAIAASRPEETP